ncbi:uncharacterized protein [Prorops nasuta]|uniref:uncharacterized protein n=1 Tax=Prorops nasuta TaxID=863751 RepID=UPI0034CEA37C
MVTKPCTVSLSTVTPALTPQLVMSAIVKIRDSKGQQIEARAILDTCSTANFITIDMVQRIKLQTSKMTIPIGSLNNTTTVTRGLLKIQVQSKTNDYKREITCLVIPTISDLIPTETFPRHSIRIPANIKLADALFHIPRRVDLLIGAGVTASLLSVGQIRLSRDDLYAQKTLLGWVIVGDHSSDRNSKMACHMTSLEDKIIRFWESEEVETDGSRSTENNYCEEHFIKNTSRNHEGRYIVRLPFREDKGNLGSSRSLALKRFLGLERKLNANSDLKREYEQVIIEYLRLGHATIIEDQESGYYMPHHAVLKDSSNTTKLRVVFDASMKTNTSLSLNDILSIGPTIQEKLFEHLIRFRTYKYVVTGDIEKMYRQVLVADEDRKFQKFLWRIDGRIKTIQLNTLTFGIASSPFLAIRTVHQLANDMTLRFPKAAEILKNHLYVDDLLTGADSVDELRNIRDDIVDLLKHGKFKIRQWASNNREVLFGLPEDELHAKLTIKLDESLKTLGLIWDTQTDSICYTSDKYEQKGTVTKRDILSKIAQIFDPLGLIGPVISYAKIIMQKVWRSKVGWDESVSQEIYTEWHKFYRQLTNMSECSFTRRILDESPDDLQLHGFSDASTAAYGACMYVRNIKKNGSITVTLICSKSRVAPIKSVTIPRLELCGALLLANLYQAIKKPLGMKFSRVIFWCDSTITLQWIKTVPDSLKPYVSNRVKKITKLTNEVEWHHVRSIDNPADVISRGQLPHAFTKNELWFSGPTWLKESESKWPEEILTFTEVPELRKNVCLVSISNDLNLLERYSSHSKLFRIIAYCMRFCSLSRSKGVLKHDEINKAEKWIMRNLQAKMFGEEIKRLKGNNSLSEGKFAKLSLFMDNEGLLRVGGRLHKSNLTFAQKHPILLPSSHLITESIIRETHEKNYHTGIQTTLSLIRQRYWITDGKNQVRRIIRHCTHCFRFEPNTIQYKMGNLPTSRVTEAIPFENTGIDYCGPFYIKERIYRNRVQRKVYICVFVCMSIKAVHLELVSDLTSEGFLAALRRFISRRGIPRNIYSDNGTNFVGANNKLKELYLLINSTDHKERVEEFACERKVSWHFIPPLAPHFGGLWEATVRIFKHHFKRVVGTTVFTFEELNTFMVEIEAVLNSRPITSLSSDPNDLIALTPSHYLIGKPLNTLPEENLSAVADNRLSIWQRLIKMRQDFWSRWKLEYLNQLQVRQKWSKDGPELKIGAVVLIKDKQQPCFQWSLGRIEQLHPGEDGIARVATIHTTSGKLKRATNLLCPLPSN